ncbi:MAG: adenosylmethionine--8-amino-7-oxononanoate transaminase, partial [Burkholderiales bacterium]
MGNMELQARSLAAVWHPCTQMKQHETLPLIPVARAEGAWLYDFDGKRYLDAISSWWVNLFGHCNPRIDASLRHQLEKFEHVMLAGFTHEPVIELSERLSKLAPHGLGHCFYGSDGASSVEIALKMSFHFWRNSGHIEKTGFISLENSYHGETLGALSVTDIALFKDTYAPLLRNSATVPSPDWRFAEPGEYSLQYALRCAENLETHLSEHHQEIAAFIVEPLVQCAGGMAMYHPEYLKRARQICDQYQVHLIADEIAVGFGRTGTLFACQQAGITPDFLCLSKGITGGYLPLSVVMTNDMVYHGFYSDEVAHGFLHSHSYSGNALSCRAALASLDIFEQDKVIQSNYAKSAQLTKMANALTQHPKVKDFRNTGMIWAFEVDNADKNFSKNFYHAALDSGLLLRPLGNTVYFMPPYIINEQEMHFLVEKTQG